MIDSFERHAILSSAWMRTLLEIVHEMQSKVVSEAPIDKATIEKIIKTRFQRMKFTIDDNGEVTVIGHCIAKTPWPESAKLPITFKQVSIGFYCSYANLISLEGSPEFVGGNFVCDGNQLTTLSGSPSRVIGDFSCTHNQLTSLDGLPRNLLGTLHCNHNPLTSLDGLPDDFLGKIRLSWNPKLPLLRLLKCEDIGISQVSAPGLTNIMNRYCGANFSRSSIVQCQKEMVNAGFEGNASW